MPHPLAQLRGHTIHVPVHRGSYLAEPRPSPFLWVVRGVTLEVFTEGVLVPLRHLWVVKNQHPSVDITIYHRAFELEVREVEGRPNFPFDANTARRGQPNR